MKTKRKLSDFGKLTQAEQRIVDEIDSGQVIKLGDGKLPPENAGDDRKARAELIRYLAIGGCDACKTHEKGLRIWGALIEDVLDLEGCNLGRDLALLNCRFLENPIFRSACLDGLFLNGSYLHKGLRADRLETKGGVNLSQVQAEGTVSMIGAKLGGDLDCVGAAFSNAGGRALSLDGLDVTGTFFLQNGPNVVGMMVLTAATIRTLNDDPECWQKAHGDLLLDRFRYGAITSACVDAKTRKKWLALQNPTNFGHDFWPQPYEQLAKVLREMGHRGDAREILIEKEKRQRDARRKRRHKITRPFYWLWDKGHAITSRYGHQPLIAFIWLLGFWTIGAATFYYAEANDAIKPNTARILRAPEWVTCGFTTSERRYLPSMQHLVTGRAAAGQTQLACYLEQKEALSYPAFNPYIYSADTLLPIVDLEMQSNWIPDEDVIPWIRKYLWVQIIAGWFFSLLAVAGFTGLIKSD